MVVEVVSQAQVQLQIDERIASMHFPQVEEVVQGTRFRQDSLVAENFVKVHAVLTSFFSSTAFAELLSDWQTRV